jgi:hypothetical protein
MNNISMNQALGIWSELWQAYYGKNVFGGDTAEIYAFMLMPYEPVVASDNPQFRETQLFKEHSNVAVVKATNSLYALLTKFQRDTDCHITVDGKEIREWVETEVFDHRCHVRVIHTK